MFGLINASELFQGSAVRTWNCVAHFANLLWYKVNNFRQPIMPRSRRRHHSRSRSRSRSHSHDRDRDVKRRKIDKYESPHHRRSVSEEPEAIAKTTTTTVDDQPKLLLQSEEKNNAQSVETKAEEKTAKTQSKTTPGKLPLKSPRGRPPKKPSVEPAQAGGMKKFIEMFKKKEEVNKPKVKTSTETVISIDSEDDEPKPLPQDDAKEIEEKPLAKSSNKDNTNKDENKDTENKDAENKDAENKDAENKDADNKDAENKDVENKDVKNKDAENKDVENKDVENKDVKNKDAENKDSDNKNVENKVDANKDDDDDKDESKESVDESESQKENAEPENDDDKMDVDMDESVLDDTLNDSTLDESSNPNSSLSSKILNKTAEGESKKPLTPKQLQRRKDIEMKREEKRREREERERKKQEERDRLKEEKQKQRLEKEEQKRKEIEEKREQKRKEREEKEEQKRKEKEEKEEQKRKEKNKEKLKLDEQMQKSKAVFANFFVAKKPDVNEEKKETPQKEAFMPFEVKSDMRLAPIVRRKLDDGEKVSFENLIEEQSIKSDYLAKIKTDARKAEKTWPVEDSDDVVIVEDNLGESIEEEKPKSTKMRAKFLKFDENQRPAYYGTWRKRSKRIRARCPFKMDEDILNYEVDSDEEWEEEDPGESLKGSDDEEKEESDNEYEVDNEFFVPHGHLSEDEMDDEEDAVLNPENHKAKLKLLKSEFEEEHKTKTQKIKPRLIGCIWYDSSKKVVDDAIHRYLKPFAVIHNGQVRIKSRNDLLLNNFQKDRTLRKELIPDLLRLLHGNKNKRKFLVDEFMEYLNSKDIELEISRGTLTRQIKFFAQWMRCREKETDKMRYCWFVSDKLRREYNLNNLTLTNQWKYVSKESNEGVEQ